MTKPNKTKLQFILGAILVVSLTVAGCNNKGSEKTTTTDTVRTDTMMPPPSMEDTTMDTTPGKVKPIIESKPK